MEISHLLAPEAVICSLRAQSKKQALHDLAARASQLTGTPAPRIFELLMERERLGSTGMGDGIAIPHARLPGLPGIVGVFARLEPPLEYDAIDGRPVDLIFLLLTPAEAGADHLKALARVSRLLRHPGTCEMARAAPKAEVLYAVLTSSAQIPGAQAA